jgi:ribosomal protein L11 methyltransferase
MAWIELSLDATQEAVDWISTLLSTIEYDGEINVTPYQTDDATDRSIAFDRDAPDASGNLASEPDWAFTIYLYLPEQAPQAEIEQIRNLLLPLQRTELATDLRLAEVDEQHSPVQHLSPGIRRIGQRFVVLAPNSTYQPHSVRDIPLTLETSRSFGSGLHPTTVISLRLLERHIVPAMYVLDLGSGTGILSVAMAKLGARVLALDNDRLAVQATQAAISLNQVEPTVTAMEGSLGRGSDLGHWMGRETIGTVPTVEPAGAFDLIIANILPWIHIKLASDFRQALQPSSSHRLLLTAGYTTEYEPEVVNALADVGFESIDREQQDEWVALAFRLEEKS